MEEEQAAGLESPEVVTKYKMAGEMANRVLREVASKAVKGASVLSLAQTGDEMILKEVSGVYNKKVEGKPVEKGIGFPTCISVNHCVCHNSPLKADPEVLLADGDVVKIDLGVHIDGYIAVVATTVVVGASKENPVTGKKADVIACAHYAAEVALRMIRPGAKSEDVTKAIQAVATDFNCKPIEGMLSNQLTRNRIDAEKAIVQNPSEAVKKEHKECVFEVNEVYAIDMIISSGDGKPKLGDQKTSVYKKTDDVYQLKMKASRAFFVEVTKKFTTMPFTLRACEDEVKARLGATECSNHGVVEPLKVLWEKEGEYVAQFKIVTLLMPNGSLRVTSGMFDPEVIKSEFSVQNEDLKKLLATSVGNKTKKKKKKAKKTEGTDATATTEATPETE